MHIYHVMLPEAWNARQSDEAITADSLTAEGFIHCSSAEQLEGVLERYFGGVSRVVILEIDPDKLSSKLVFEPSTNNEVYPHVYGPIDPEAIVRAEERQLRPGG
jgi:uncharacterized protein (DUF952 family)